MWTRICNLQMETNLPPLKARIQVRNTNIAAKSLLSGRASFFNTRIKQSLARHPDLPSPNTFSNHIKENIKSCGVMKELTNISPDVAPVNNLPLAPWEPHPATFNYTALPASKSICTPEMLLQAAQTAIATAEQHGGTVYYTDGSVNPDTQSTGAAVYSRRFTASWRTSNSCSTLQTELAAIKQTLAYSIANEQGPVVIHTDSRSSLQALQQTNPKENRHLIHSIITLMQQHRIQGRPVTLNWIPSHIGIPGNDKADELAKLAIVSPSVQMEIQPSLQQLKNLAKPTLQKTLRENHQRWVNNHSPSANWYQYVTELQPSPISKYTPRKLAVIIARLRLGYKCCWEITAPQERECSHCDHNTNFPLLHYLLECPTTSPLRVGLGNPVGIHHPQAIPKAKAVVQQALCNLDTYEGLLLSHPPPR